MRSEREIREKIASLNDAFKMTKSAKITAHERQTLKEDIYRQIDMLLWVLEDKSGFDPLDERIEEILTSLEQ